ncbi:hypothetical protein F3J29_16640 [Enterobacter sp. Cy-643]|uniref:pentapeptide repeat-containing protein n=1 Tax=Enterobacter sp. Cy-643 TaxID=2608346 RepID=UPI001420D66A|nr:pentapeptide repeat-containing protein [Enterobacter sp. Cy-643]NIF33757.1 hypothetical protein [Enterobacter sp. Cy-643]
MDVKKIQDPFFSLKSPFNIFSSEEELSKLLLNSSHIKNILYQPEKLSIKSIDGIVFENVSLSKTTLSNITIKKCKFIDCLFIGCVFDDVRFHDCIFERCNFFRVKFNACYGRPSQFENAIRDKKYANIAVHLFDQLRSLYRIESQKRYKSEAEYHFNKWNYILSFSKKPQKKDLLFFYAKKIVVKTYGILFGYGYRLRNLVRTTLVAILGLMSVNFIFGAQLFESGAIDTFEKTIYFTLTTMFTLGASGFESPTNLGMWLILLNMILGISLLTFTVSALFNRIIK